MKPYSRAERISVKIQQAITELLNRKMQDPRMEMATISSVKLSPDLRVAFVHVAVFGDKKKFRQAMEGFTRSKGYIKRAIAPKLGLKYMPDLRFVRDETFDKAARLDALIQSAQPEDTDSGDPESPAPDDLPDRSE